MNDLQIFLEKFAQTMHLELFYLGTTAISLFWLLEALLAIGLLIYGDYKLGNMLKYKVGRATVIGRQFKRMTLFASRFAFLLFGTWLVLQLLGVSTLLFGGVAWLYQKVRALLELRLFTLGKSPITIISSFYILTLAWLIVYAAGRANNWLVSWLEQKTHMDQGLRFALGAVLRYTLISVGLIVVVQSAGIDLSALTILAGAIGIAIGLALQGITNNFISGLIVLFERPIKIGDYVDIGGTTGNVVNVSLRATTILTNDNIAIIVPNSQFITSQVVNWTYNDRRCAFSIPVSVANTADPNVVKSILLHVAGNHPGILKNPEPQVLFNGFADNQLKFALRVWTSDFVSRPALLVSDLNFLIVSELAKHNIELPGKSGESKSLEKERHDQKLTVHNRFAIKQNSQSESESISKSQAKKSA